LAEVMAQPGAAVLTTIVNDLSSRTQPLFLGPAAALLMLADEAMREAGDWRDIGLGLILAGVVLLPRGLAGLRINFRSGG
jgi:hypothetical protein